MRLEVRLPPKKDGKTNHLGDSKRATNKLNIEYFFICSLNNSVFRYVDDTAITAVLIPSRSEMTSHFHSLLTSNQDNSVDIKH